MTVAWDSAGGASGYGVYRATSPHGKYKLVKAVTGTSYIDTGIAAGLRPAREGEGLRAVFWNKGADDIELAVQGSGDAISGTLSSTIQN